MRRCAPTRTLACVGEGVRSCVRVCARASVYVRYGVTMPARGHSLEHCSCLWPHEARQTISFGLLGLTTGLLSLRVSRSQLCCSAERVHWLSLHSRQL